MGTSDIKLRLSKAPEDEKRDKLLVIAVKEISDKVVAKGGKKEDVKLHWKGDYARSILHKKDVIVIEGKDTKILEWWDLSLQFDVEEKFQAGLKAKRS